MNKRKTQMVTISSLDWCLRYFKSYYPKQSWETWSKQLYWGHFNEHLTPPFILKRLDGEFCLCKKLGERDILLEHPLEGELSYLKTSFTHFFYNEVMAYQTSVSFQLEQSLVRQIIHQFLHFLWKHPKQLWSMLFICLAYELFSLIEPFGLSFLIEHLNFFAKTLDFCMASLFLGFGMGIVWTLSYFRQSLSLYLIGINAHYFSIFVWSRYFSASLADISKLGIAEVFPRLFSLDQMAYRLLQQFTYLSFDLFFFGFNLMILACINHKLVCLDLLIFLLLFAASMIILKVYQRYASELLDRQQEFQAFSLDMLQHINETKLWQQEHLFLGKWKEKNKSFWQAFLSNELQQFKLDWLIDGVKKLNFLLIITCGLYLVRHQELSLGLLIAYLSLKIQVFARFEAMLHRLNQSQYVKVSLRKLSQLFQKLPYRKLKRQERMKERSDDILLKDIEFKGQVLQDLLFQPGQNYFIYGPSGRGKTSLLKAIMGLDTPIKAKILYHGKNCQEDDWYEIRRDVSIILPDQGLLQGNLIDNITMFAANPDMIYLERLRIDLAIDMDFAAEIARNMPPISAGQQQKILLARALYRRPKWLILDEATCHLDEGSEQNILMRILDYPCSLIVVNHRQHVATLFDHRLCWDDLLFC